MKMTCHATRPVWRWFSFALLFLFVASSGGCAVLETIVYVIKGTDEDPKYDILMHDQATVVVVCQSVASDQYRNETVPRDIARQVTDLLDENIKGNKKLTFVPSSKVEAWLDNCDNRFERFEDVGRAKGINADIVIGIELQDFRITDPQSPMLYQGKAVLNIRAISCEDGKVLAREQMRFIDPPNMPLDASRTTEQAFRANFVDALAKQIACLFHRHDPKRIRRMDADSMHLH